MVSGFFFLFYKWYVTWLKILLCHLLNVCCPCSALASFPLTPELLKISSPDSFYECSLYFEINFKIGSPGTLTAVCVGGTD